MDTYKYYNASQLLLAIPVGKTRVVYDHVVTRWAVDKYEVGTWGVAVVGLHKASMDVVG